MERELLVYVDINRVPIHVGRLWVRERQQKETSTFQYAPEWLKHREKFALSPTLSLGPGQFQSIKGLFNAFSDAAPDRWGQKLMRHHERNRAKESGTAARVLFSADFLAGVDDYTRMGALRFKEPGKEPFIAQTGVPVPPILELRTLLSATDRIEKGKERKNDIALVLAPGGSLGGARPKATVRDRDGSLFLAKFPWAKDEWPVIQWETATLMMAKTAGLEVPAFRVELAGTKPVLMISRFDRGPDQTRYPFMSAYTALDAVDHDEDRSYLELVDSLRQLGSAPVSNLHQLWRRMVFNVLVSNTDDHLRNHGFLRRDGGWGLAPAYDMNPTPFDISGRIHVLALNEMDHTGSLDIALSVHEYFALTLAEARAIAGEVGAAVSAWKEVAKQCRLTKNDCERMESAFEHDDLKLALKNVVSPTSRTKAPKGTPTTPKKSTSAAPKPSAKKRASRKTAA